MEFLKLRLWDWSLNTFRRNLCTFPAVPLSKSTNFRSKFTLDIDRWLLGSINSSFLEVRCWFLFEYLVGWAGMRRGRWTRRRSVYMVGLLLQQWSGEEDCFLYIPATEDTLVYRETGRTRGLGPAFNNIADLLPLNYCHAQINKYCL